MDLHPEVREISCSRVAIFMRWLFDELVMIENSTGRRVASSNWPAASMNIPLPLEADAPFRRLRGCGMSD